MVEIRFEGSAEEIRKEMQVMLGGHESHTASAPLPALNKTPAAPKEKKPAEAAAPKAAESSAPAVKTAEDLANEARAVVTKMVAHEKIGKPGVIKFFAEHFAPAKKVGELQPAEAATYQTFIDKANALMAAE